jgi:hypothetical protein
MIAARSLAQFQHIVLLAASLILVVLLTALPLWW